MPDFVVQRRWTRDARVPRVAGDDDFVYGWQCIPQRPTPDEGWEICDSSRDRKTRWQRVVPAQQLTLFGRGERS
jgi:hypothetical protein